MGMKKNRAASAGLLAIAIGIASPAAFAETVTKPAAGASRILFKLPGELRVRFGQQEQVSIDAEASIIPKLQVEVRGDTLTLASKTSFKTNKPLTITVTLKSFRSLKSEGSGDATVENFSGGDMEINGAGSGGVSLKGIKAERLALVIKGSGDMDAAGGGKTLVARIEGSGTIDAVKYRAKSVEASIDGSGDIKVHADESLKASINGAGNIGYEGKPKVAQSVNGAGSVDQL